MDRMKEKLAQEFEMKDLGHIGYFLGMEVARYKIGISVSQRKYVLDLLIETRMIGSKIVDTPMDANSKIESSDEDKAADKDQRLVGNLMHLAYTTEHSFFNKLCKSIYACTQRNSYGISLQNPQISQEHSKQGLLFKRNEGRSVGIFTNTDWVGSPSDRRSTSGYCSFVLGNLGPVWHCF